MGNSEGKAGQGGWHETMSSDLAMAETRRQKSSKQLLVYTFSTNTIQVHIMGVDPYIKHA